MNSRPELFALARSEVMMEVATAPHRGASLPFVLVLFVVVFIEVVNVYGDD